MTRKDYVLLSDAIREQTVVLRNDAAYYNTLALAVVQGVAERIALKLAQDNPRFDYRRFMEAAGFPR